MENERMALELWRAQVESAIYSLVKVSEELHPSMSRKVISQKGAAVLLALRPIIPYCLQPAGTSGAMIFANRDYLPLGLAVPRYAIPEYVDRALYTWAHIPPDNPISRLGSIYFWGDGSAPWRSRGGLESLIEKLTQLLTMEDDFNNSSNRSFDHPTDEERQQ